MSETPLNGRKERRPDWAALLIAIALAVLAGVIAWDASTLRVTANYSGIGPQTFPYVVAAFLFILAIWTVFEAVRGEFPEREHDEIGPIAWIVGGLAAQMMLLNVAGFSIATGLLFAATARGFGQRKFYLSIPIGIVLSYVVWVLFAKLLQLSLPAGPLENLLFK
ncbi:tripartite tricarboxylate transporter TctB family protein [Devosia sp. D6-9]|nr:tripartite tricarboxylate transporter TctB family protein [Devosia sp. D6-9]